MTTTHFQLRPCLAVLLSWVACAPVFSAPAVGPLRVHPTNPRYFTDGTTNRDGSLKAVYLTGSHTWGNLCDAREGRSAFDFTGYLDFLERHRHNFIRLWTGDGIGHQPVPFDPTKGATASSGNVQAADGQQPFKAPFAGDAVLWLMRAANHSVERLRTPASTPMPPRGSTAAFSPNGTSGLPAWIRLKE